MMVAVLREILLRFFLLRNISIFLNGLGLFRQGKFYIKKEFNFIRLDAEYYWER